PFRGFVENESLNVFDKLFKNSWEQDCKGELMLGAGDNICPVQLSLTRLELDEQPALSIILTVLTTQKNTQKQLRKNNEQLEEINLELELSNHDLHQFASVASHDLQEPLRKIQIFSNLMKEKQDDLSPDLKKYLDKIIESSGRMKTLIVDILNYSRLSANISRIEKIDLNEMVKEILEDFELIIHEKSAKITLAELPVIFGKKGQIRQIFQNIISNALKFSVPGHFPSIIISGKKIKEKTFNIEED